MRTEGEPAPAPSCLGTKGLSWPGGWKERRGLRPHARSPPKAVFKRLVCINTNLSVGLVSPEGS